MKRRTLLQLTGSAVGTTLPGGLGSSCAPRRVQPTNPLALDGLEAPRSAPKNAPSSPLLTAATEADIAVQECLRRVQRLEAELGGRIGLYAVSVPSGRSMAHRADERFAMCSTFKWALAAAVLHASEQGHLELHAQLPFGPKDLDEWAPVTKLMLQRGRMRIDELAEAAVTMSDNTATNLLLAHLGGPAKLTRFFRALGDDVTRLDRMEPLLNENAPGDLRDTTTARAMAEALRQAFVGTLLSEESKMRLRLWLEQTETGLDRLRAGLPTGMRAGDKTGTGNRGAVNDVAIAWPDQQNTWLIASYLSGSDAPLAELKQAHAKIGGWISEAFLAVG